MSVKSKHSTTKKDKLGKKEKKKKLEESEDDIESSEEELDLTKECHPIGYYMNDRAEMINQMFSVIKGNKLKALLPPTLKDYDIDQLKLQCLDQLLGMSERRINCILEGETLETSSESDVAESDECDSHGRNRSSSESTSDRSEDSQEDGYTNEINNKHKKRKATVSSEGKGSKVAKRDSENAPPEKGKTLLEILELEMRARAIRALLKQSGSDNLTEESEENKSKDISNGVGKDNSSEVVDLTVCEDEDCTENIIKDNSNEVEETVSTFEEKIEKSQSEKSNTVTSEKSKRLQAELELRNKLFKKKIYRTRQQRMENEEEEKSVDKSETDTAEDKNDVNLNNIIKHEGTKPEKVPIEDPEEGEINTSEDETKQEVPEKPKDSDNCESKVDEDIPKVTNDNITAVSDSNMENMINTEDNENEISPLSVPEESISKDVDSEIQPNVDENKDSFQNELSHTVEETSWRDRWLQKDGVQKLVKSSKILAKVKKRIAEKTQRVREEVPNPYDVNSDSNSNSKLEVIEGSIEEYERLLNDDRGQ